MLLPRYFDYAATTPVDPRVAEAMAACLTIDGNFGNPASRSHVYGWKAEEAVELARGQLADLLQVDPREIVWTSGATESDNLAIKGVAQHFGPEGLEPRGTHIISSAAEHKAVLDSCAVLERNGFEVTYLKPSAQGVIEPQQLAEALRDDTILVSLMHANNETGALNDIAALGSLCRQRGVLLHVDAAQSVGKVPLNLGQLDVDLLSISAHKFYGPKGIGALYVRRDPAVRLQAQMHGGGHERGMRSGTLATHQIVGLGEAARIAGEEMQAETRRIGEYREQLWRGLQALQGVQLNGHPEQCLPGILNLSFAGVDGELLLIALKDLALSTGSACASASIDPSHVLQAMGVPRALALSSLRFSLGRYSTADDIEFALQRTAEALDRLRQGSSASPASRGSTAGSGA
jgi:cysteine desulfurase